MVKGYPLLMNVLAFLNCNISCREGASCCKEEEKKVEEEKKNGGEAGDEAPAAGADNETKTEEEEKPKKKKRTMMVEKVRLIVCLLVTHRFAIVAYVSLPCLMIRERANSRCLAFAVLVVALPLLSVVDRKRKS